MTVQQLIDRLQEVDPRSQVIFESNYFGIMIMPVDEEQAAIDGITPPDQLKAINLIRS